MALLGGVKMLLQRRLNKRWRFLILLRETEYCFNVPSFFNRILYIYKKFRFKKVSQLLGYTIPINTFGPGLSLPHNGTIIVNGAARIGAFCRLHCCTNIGASTGEKKAPHIGDNVYIGPGAILFGNITIANNITIGANATVNHSFLEENVAIGGTPAKVIKRNMRIWKEFNNLRD